MQIEVKGDESIGRQTRTYAEYRLFAALAPLMGTRSLRNASVVLRRAKARRGERVVCTLAVESADGGVARFSAAGGHPYQAINRAVDRVRLGPWPHAISG